MYRIDCNASYPSRKSIVLLKNRAHHPINTLYSNSFKSSQPSAPLPNVSSHVNHEELSHYFDQLNKAYLNPDFSKKLKERTYNMEIKPPQNSFIIPGQDKISFEKDLNISQKLSEHKNDIFFKPFYSTDSNNKILMSNRPIPLLNFYKVDDHLYRGGQPGFFTYKVGEYDENVHLDMNKIKTDLEFLREKFNIKTILNLRHNGDIKRYPDINDTEEKLIEEMNNDVLNGRTNKSFIRYIHKPLLNENLEISRNNILTIINILKNKDNYPLYVHCSEGRDRTGIITALYKILIKNTNMKEFVDELIFTDFDLGKRHGLVTGLMDLLEAKIDKLPDFYVNHFHSINQLKKLTPEEFKTYGEILKKLFSYK